METTFRVRMNLLGNNVSRGVMFETASFSFYPLTEWGFCLAFKLSSFNAESVWKLVY